jgi:hypothetical protein
MRLCSATETTGGSSEVPLCQHLRNGNRLLRCLGRLQSNRHLLSWRRSQSPDASPLAPCSPGRRLEPWWRRGRRADEDEVRLVTRSIVDGRPGLPWQKALGFPTRRARWRVHGWSRTRVLQGTWFEPPYGAICQTVPGVPGLPVLVIAVPFMSQM